MVGDLPPGIDDWSLSYLDYAIASAKSCFSSRFDEVNVSPLKSVIVNIVCDLAQQNSVVSQDPIGFFDERRVGMGKIVVCFGR